MATKSETRQAITREKIVDAFRELILVKKLDDITVTEICDKAGVSRTAFYHNFADLSDVLDAAVLVLDQALEDIRITGENFREQYLSLLRGIYSVILTYRKYCFNVIQSKLSVDLLGEYINKPIFKHIDDLFGPYKDFVERKVPYALFRNNLLGIIVTTGFTIIREQYDGDLETVVEHTFLMTAPVFKVVMNEDDDVLR